MNGDIRLRFSSGSDDDDLRSSQIVEQSLSQDILTADFMSLGVTEV